MIRKIILVICSLSSLTFAQVDQKSLDAANELADILGLTNQMEAGFNSIMPVIEQQAKQMKLNDEQEARLKRIYKSWYMEDFDHKSLAKEIVKIYAQVFSIEELKELTAFYKTPLGKKTLKVLPELVAKGAKLGAIEGQKKQPKLLERLKPLLEELKK